MTTPPPEDPYGAQPGGYGAPPPGGGYGAQPAGGGYGGAPAAQSNGPTILGIIGIVCWFCCSPASIVLGLIGQSQAAKNGQPTTLPRIAWIGGIVFLILGLIYYFLVIRSTGSSRNIYGR